MPCHLPAHVTRCHSPDKPPLAILLKGAHTLPHYFLWQFLPVTKVVIILFSWILFVSVATFHSTCSVNLGWMKDIERPLEVVLSGGCRTPGIASLDLKVHTYQSLLGKKSTINLTHVCTNHPLLRALGIQPRACVARQALYRWAASSVPTGLLYPHEMCSKTSSGGLESRWVPSPIYILFFFIHMHSHQV